MIFVDSNVPMYLVGSSHPNKGLAAKLLDAAIKAEERLVTDAEVLQEILHRYCAINRIEAITPAFEVLLAIVDEVFPVYVDDVQRAKDIVLGFPELSARDAIHVATMERHKINEILSFDRGFDVFKEIVRRI